MWEICKCIVMFFLMYVYCYYNLAPQHDHLASFLCASLCVLVYVVVLALHKRNGKKEKSMDLNYEQEFVQKFVKKACRERLLFELSTKKRQAGLSKFCHNADQILDERYVAQTATNLNKESLERNFALFSADVYMLTERDGLGRVVTLGEAVEHMQSETMPVIIYRNNFAIVKTETEGAQATYYLMKRSE